MIDGKKYTFTSTANLNGDPIAIGTKFKVTKSGDLFQIQFYEGGILLPEKYNVDEDNLNKRSSDMTEHRKRVIGKYLMHKFINK